MTGIRTPDRMFSWHELYHWAITSLWYFDLLILCCTLNITKLPRHAPGYHCVMILTRGTLSTYVCTKANYVGIGAFTLFWRFTFPARARYFAGFKIFSARSVVRRRSCCPELNREEDSYVCTYVVWGTDWKTTMMCSTTFVRFWPCRGDLIVIWPEFWFYCKSFVL